VHRSSEGSPVAEDDAAAAFQIIMDSGRCSCTRLFSIPIRWSRHRLAMRSGGRITQLLAMSSGHQGHQLVVIRRVEHLARPGPRSVGLAANPEAASERCAFSILVHCSAPTLQLRLLLLRGLVQTRFAKLREPAAGAHAGLTEHCIIGHIAQNARSNTYALPAVGWRPPPTPVATTSCPSSSCSWAPCEP
jgi:hypothetical protein